MTATGRSQSQSSNSSGLSVLSLLRWFFFLRYLDFLEAGGRLDEDGGEARS